MPQSTYDNEQISIERGWLDALLAELQSLVGSTVLEKAAMKADLASISHKLHLKESAIQELTNQIDQTKEAETPQPPE